MCPPALVLVLEIGLPQMAYLTPLCPCHTHPAPADEVHVQKALSDLVGGDRSLMQGCFLVDQLVFQEMMYR